MRSPNELKCGNFRSISVVFPGRSLDIYFIAECHLFVHPTWSWGERLYGIQPWRINPQIIPEGWVRAHFPELLLVMVKCSQRSSWSSFIWQASIQTVSLLPWLLHWNFRWNQSMCHCIDIAQNYMHNGSGYRYSHSVKKRRQQYWNKLHLLNINKKNVK